MKTQYIIALGILFFIFACTSPEAKEKINKAGDIAGQTVGEFVSGVSNGVSKAFDVQIELPPNLASKGLQFGKTTVSSDTVGSDNLLTVYLIFDDTYQGTLTAKAFDNHGLEMGRVRTEVKGKKGDAKFVDFHFDRRTNIDNDSKITIE